jgi:hypothetical protein
MSTKNLVHESRNLYYKIFRLVELGLLELESARSEKTRTAFIHAHARFRRRQRKHLAFSANAGHHWN